MIDTSSFAVAVASRIAAAAFGQVVRLLSGVTLRTYGWLRLAHDSSGRFGRRDRPTGNPGAL
ncbi:MULTISPECIES: hypothetical protein [Mycobacterium]|uniref:hypothetical protein n=1 Tax=Mycobacterium TaxID=1763 RepID=UPI00109EBD90|nr:MULTISPECIES: hypothetical protein [Mycobacterium]MCA2310023.1 hypothetical protein [Mycobacterium intracellulare subsp. chimaera]MCA2353046.1 hypothetical protein [Mycobacterium intracellulare subsp. chimaera]MCV7323606.1 hypothetical protein [Mycobacterium intracellulare subsp. chimaera]MDM3907592.1 hypothetical protein [Mycobacterium intracellulare subsp. chimaera]MDM3930854.1 hypothetical protein [Mycobacterium intracellulare subsp. chimaera]